jgi:hypothetical protein
MNQQLPALWLLREGVGFHAFCCFSVCSFFGV